MEHNSGELHATCMGKQAGPGISLEDGVTLWGPECIVPRYRDHKDIQTVPYAANSELFGAFHWSGYKKVTTCGPVDNLSWSFSPFR